MDMPSDPARSSAEDPLQLLDSWHRGDRSALDRLLADLHPWLHAEVRRSLGNRPRGFQDSMDLAQNAVVNFLRWGPRFLPKTVAQLHALLRRIAQNEIVDDQRQQSRKGRHLESFGGPGMSTSAFGPPEASAAGPATVAELDEESGWVRLALQFLSAEDRRLLLASEVEAQEWASLATELDLASADAARMRCKRLKPKLANLVRQLRNGRLPVEH